MASISSLHGDRKGSSPLGNTICLCGVMEAHGPSKPLVEVRILAGILFKLGNIAELA